MIISMVEQLSDRWFQEHAGKPGAGSNDKIITSTGKRSTQRKDHLYKLTAEALLGEKEHGYTNSTMDEGTAREAESRDLFAFLYDDVEVHQVGMCYRDEKLKYLCSPDGLIWEGDDWIAGLECKNPLAKTHVSYLVGKKLPTKYVVQVQSSLFITGLPLWYFCSYVPGLDPFIVPVHPDLEFHKKLEVELELFCSELGMMINSIRNAK
jgi:hypothetical protein